MGFGRGLPSWALTFMIFCIQQKASGTESPETVTIIPPPTTTPVITSFNPAHNGRVCSTWGNFYYKTFDGDIYHFPGACNYVFASHCNAPFEDFNIQIRRNNGERSIKDITVMLSGVYIKIQTNDTLVNNERVQLPYSGSGVSIEIAGNSMRLSAKQLQLMWNRDDSLMLELDEKYANQTCGLCGDFNGIPTYNEFYSNNAKLTPLQFGNMQKMNGPEEDCKDPTASSLRNCANISNVCQEILTGPSFSDCNNVVGVNEYIEACGQDLCLCDQNTTFSCLCDTFAEYSRQCAHAGGHPQNWRSPDFCPMTCPFNMQYQECGSACADTCTNSERSQLCEDHCLDGCFCPAGMVYDDINNSGCLPIQQCSCVYNGKVYAPGTTYSDRCRSCSCSGGQWSCTEMPCPGICSVEGGSHISSYDEKRYNVHGDCTYVLSKLCDGETFTVLGELRKCGLTDTETCLKMVALSINGGLTTIVVKSSGAVFVNWIYTQLPISAANVTMFRASSFFIIAETNFGIQLEIQLVPIMQLFVRLDPSYKGKTCGLCGNFDSRQTDDFTAMSGVVEGTAPAFANTWKTQATCPNIKQNFEDPCSLSVENEKYAHHWCGLLTDSEGPFAKCHPSVNPAAYHTNCMFDTCNCERSEDCMCAVLSAYVRACVAKGVELPGWRTDVCSKYTTSCPKSLAYSYTISSCQPTCRSLSEPDITCNIKFVPVDGCTCINGTYMDESGKCVPASNCPCYYKGTAIQPSEVLHEAGVACTCAQGKLSCIGNIDLTPVCTAPMVYFDCKNATTGSTGAECQKSCHTLDMQCYSTQCMSGCVCPAGLVSDGKGNCIAMEGCPCIHNDATYNPGEEIKVDCNTCVCKNRMWKCTKNKCLGTCAVYGDGHYITFDDKRYNFNGKCEYTLLQDHCGQNSSSSFSIITENIPCGSTGTTCSKSIKVFLKNYELILSEEQSKIVARGGGGELPYRIRQMGIYLVIETTNVIILWDKKTSIFIKISPDFKGQVCGLCGNYDGNGINDFTTRSQSVVGDVLEFGNSWKVSPTCPDAKCTKDPCSKNPYRKSWSQKQCSIINSNVFADCHSQVEPTKYYEACVTDACACDTGGDCECFCTAVAAYAQACSEFGVCISWRTPSVCPMFCDYYNAERECDWHYKSCGAPCMKTCRNPSGRCLHELPGLEGCYPYCPADKPYFNEEEMKCVDQCGCYDAEDNYYPPGTHFDLRDTCQSCTCTNQGIMCNYNSQACYCYYEGKEYIYKEVIYNTTDGLGWCMTAICDVNGTIHREADKCEGLTTTLPPFTFTTIPSTSETGLTAPATTACVHKVCEWSEWYDVSYPTFGQTNGDYETPENIRAKGLNFCKLPEEVQCRAEQFPNTNIEDLNQNIQCTKDTGLICNNKDQMPPICLNYQIKFLCCMFIPCEMSSPTPTTTSIGTITTTMMPGSTTPSITETTCAPQCSWTAWFDVSSPTSDPKSGDLETLANIRASGQEVCDKPQSIECRAENYPNVPISELAQTVRCDLKTGLECLNTEQKGKYPVCFNYQVRFNCCYYAHCPPGTTPGTTTAATSTGTPASSPGATPGHTSAPPSSSTGSTPPPIVQTTTQGTTVVATSPAKGTTTTLSTPLSTAPGTTTGPGSTPAVTSATVSTTTATSLQSTPLSKPTGSIPTKGTTPQVPATSVATSTTAALPGSTTPSVIETTCSPRCSWTAWFDVSSPTSDPKSGDLETLANIRASGQEVCDKPQSIECRAENYPNVPISELAQTVRCDLKTGLECLNTEQKGKYPVCFNYQVRFHCCDYAHCPPGTTPGTTTAATSTGTPASSPGATPGHTSAPPSSSTGSTPPPIVQTTTQGTTVVATSPAKGTTTTLSTPLSTAPGTTTGPGSTPAVTSATVSTTTATSLQSTPVSKPTGSIPTKGTTPQVPATSVATSTTAALPGSTTPSVIETTCSPRCSWTAWFDVSSPTSDPKSGDLETLANIRASGQEVCDKPQSIECRAENYPNVPISELAQTVRCDLKTGLECLNTEQKGKYPVCFNYQVRFHCCDYAHCPPGTTPGTTTAATSTGTPASSPGATPGHTSAPPSSSTGSTPPPIVQTTTQGTTVVATSPAKGTTTTLSTPLSTAPGTTTGPGSTPAVTSATVSTTTATSLQSTPLSKPTGSIPSKGTTPQVPATSVATSTTAALPGSTTPSVIETTCSPRCSWTAWFDVSSPTSDPKSGDLETLANIRASGQEVCDKPQSIECRAENYPNVPISELAQTVRCDLKTGLECLNTEQKGKYPVCFNYQVRFHCCDYAHCPPGTTPGTTTAATSTGTPASSPGATPGHTSAPPLSSTGSTPPPIVQTTTQGTTVVATSPAKGTTTTLSTPLSTSPGTTTGPGSTPAVTSATVSTTTATSLQSTPLSKPTGSIPTKGTTPQVPATSVATSTTAALPGSTTPSVIETTCSPRCSWTAWFDVSSPTSDPKSGDLETLANIRASGQEVCDKPQSIECRAENHPDVPISELAQTVRCDLKTGLQCLNTEQKGKYPVCFNYQVRFHCCDYAHCPPGTTPGTTTAATSTGTPASSPGATPGHTSAPPSSSTGSTPPPIVQTTTQGTTVVATSPAKGTTTTLSTPLSTVPGTTTGPGSTPAVTSATVSTTTATSLQSTPVSKPTGSIPTKGTTPQVPATSVATSTTAALPGSTTPSVIETTCSPRCSWTAWFDVSSPTSDPKSGDLETLANIRASGQEVCDKPQSIECRAENHPDVPISELAQTVRCDLKTGLECLNTEQKGKYPVCFNYQVRFHCCDYAHCPPGTTPGTTTAATSTGTPASSPGATPGHTSAPPSSSTGSTPPPIVQTTTQGTTVVATSPAKGTTTTLSTPLSTVPGTTTGPGRTPAVTSATVSTTTATSLQSTPVSKPTGSIPTKGTTPQVPATSVATSTTAALPGSTTPSVIETTCSPRCSWTAWFDVSSPTSDPKSGDLETLANIRASGQEVCDKPQSIECRAENYPNVPISELAQTVRCDLKTGLECLNTEQKGKYPVCFNYQVRFHCCDYAHCPPGTTPGTTTAATSTGTLASSPGATPGHTSAPPSSSTGSTPPPIVQTTTQGTTVVATSPAKGTTTTLSTPLSTAPGTTTGPGSTPAVTSATVSTTTATSLQSTPLSKPTGSIPSKGTTPQVPATSVATSTTAALPGSTTPSVIETTCSPRCSWTAWFDVSSPTSDPKSGDLETLANIRASGQEVCDKPQSIECRAENYPNVPISELAQTVRCDLKTGLECLNTEQKGKYPVCFNYQVRFHCCDYAHCPPGTTPGTTTAATSTGTPASSPGATPGHTSAPPLSSTGSTPPPIVQTTTQGTTVVATSPAKGTTTTLSTPLSTSPGTTTGPGSTPAVTSATVSTTTATSLQSTPLSKPTGSIPTKGTTPQVPATSVATSTTAALPGSTTPSVIETTCSPRCSWTAWFDVSSPTSDPKSGDLETLANIRASGQEVCDKPQSIECRAENHPDVPISELAQTVRCDLKTGLECLNTEQKGKYPVCFNYQVRFHCCDYAHCPPGTTPGTTTAATSTGTPASSPGATPGHTSAPPSSSTGSTPPPIVQTTTQGTTVVATSPAKGTTTTLSTPLSTVPGTTTGPGSTPAVTSATVSTTTATSLQSTPVSKPTGSIPTKGTTPQVPATSVATSTTAALPGSTTPSVIETTCSPRCSWTAWFDVSSPTSDPKSGDLETLANIRASGQEVCDKPQSIECRAENHPDVPISELAQTVRCDLKTGLECLNTEQKGKYPVCFNYQVRFHCCDYAHCPPGTTPGTTTAATSTGTPASSPGATPGHTSAPPSSSTGSTPPPIVQTTTQGTTVVATSPAKGTTTTLSTPLSTAPGTTTGPGRTPAVTSATVSTTTATSLQSTPVSKPTGSIPTKGTTPQVPATSVATSTTAALPGSTTPSVIETTCSPRCSWTAWFDVSSPTSDPKSGDLETLANIRASGQEVCDKPQSIECRAENYPNVPISELAQTVRCDLKTGLECLNTEQKGKYPVCFNYQVRFHCCDYAHCPPGTTPGTTTAATSTGTLASSPGATPGHTSAPPSSSTGSTPPPIVQTTTQGTTVVATSPAKGTTTTLSTPLSTAPGTTTGPGSTPAVTSATVSTTTATSLQSTPLSKPTGSIPSKGTTPQVPATSVATSTTAALPGSTTPSVIETTCSPRCSWTAWFDVSSPTSDPKSGDLETLANIRASGQEVCDKPQSIECRAENYPNVPISELAQTVRCDLKTGLECLNTEQKGKYPVCFNYQVRFHCCDYAHCPPGTTPGTTTAATSTGTPASSPGATPGHTSAPPSSSTGSTPPPIVQTTTQGTTVVATSPAKGTTTTLSTPLSTAPGTTTGPGRTPAVTSATVSTTTATSLQSTPVSKPTGSIPTKGTTPQVPATSVATSTTAALPGSTTPSVIETTCSPRCSWTAWFDVSSPTSDPKSGDLETLANIRASGQEVCDKPQSIECRAENYPNVPISELAQTVRCDLKTGLECLNTEQKGKYPVCFNYQVRFHCCDYAHCPPGTTPGTTTAATSTGTPASSPGATPGHTSAPPSSSTGSTPPPIVQTTTQGTTVVATSPAKGTTTTLSTPLSTVPGTTTGPGSTPAVTSATVSTTTATSLQSTPVSKPTGSIPTKGTTPQVPATSVATSTTAALPGSTTPSVIETTCSPRCSWTAWFDVSSPTSDPKSGDLETLANIRASGQEVCDKPQSIECRAENHPDVPISELAQTVRCDLKTGLECLNTEQKGKYPVCFNYQVRFHCCDYAHCPPGTTPGTTTAATSTGTPASSPGATPGHTSAPPSSSTGSTPPPIVQTTTQGTTVVATSPAKGTTTTLSTPLSTVPGTTTGPGRTPAVTSATVSTTTATSLQSTPVSKPTGSIPTKGTTPQVPATSVATSTTAALPGSTTPSVIETTCSPRCSWTAWFDVSSPTSDPKSGDLETLANIRASGQEVCDKPQSIECRAENYPNVPISELAQTVRCDLKTGLECLNTEQKGKYPVCFNYQVRFHCCDYAHCPPGTTPGTTTAATSTGTLASSPGATPGHTSAPPSSSTGSTPPPIVQTTTQGTTVVATSPAKGTTTTLSTPLSTVPGTTTGPGSTPAVTSATVSTTTATSLQSTPVSKPTGSIPTKGTTPQVPATSVATSTTAALPGSTTPSVIETTCSPRCSWTAWFDVSSPTSDPKSGDLETLANIRASGQEVCDKPQSIECRAENHPDVPISELAQTVRCDLKTGLECLNTEQKGKYPVCFNYQVRFHCCDYAHCPPGTTPGTTTAATSTGTLASSPGATPGHTSAPPSSSTGSTPPPIVQTTTQGTTVVATSPAKGTTTTLSTPLSTVPGTTTGPGRTPAVTSATVSTTTATSLQSTPVSKPTGSIPTKGTTPHVPATSVATSTTAALPGSTTPSVIETTCSPRCSWTAWFDVSSPTSDPKSGDLETLANIRASGQEVCDKPQSIECRAENYPNVPISELAQTVRCDLKTGLECLNTEQKGKYPVCFNYQVRFHCCDYAHCPPGTTPGTTTAATSTGTPASSPGATPGHTSAPPSSSTGSTPPPIVQTTTQGTTVVATSPAKGTTTTLSTPLSTVPGTTTGPGSTPAVTSATVSTTTATSLQSTPVSKPTGSIPTKGTTPQVPATSVATSTTAALPGSTTPSVIETTCSPRCSWTAWFDVSSPTSDPKSGDLETLANIRASGQEVCDKPQSIECRAENYPNVPISELAQTVRCDLKTGLECLNTEQKGKYPVCFNYQVRFHCCDYAHCPPGTTPGTTTAATSTGTPASSPGSTPGHTSAPPSSSTGSTPPLIVQTSIQGTTVVPTGQVEKTTTLSTPPSTIQGTTTSPGSAPVVTSATVSTSTATSRGTPASSPGATPGHTSAPPSSSTGSTPPPIVQTTTQGTTVVSTSPAKGTTTTLSTPLSTVPGTTSSPGSTPTVTAATVSTSTAISTGTPASSPGATPSHTSAPPSSSTGSTPPPIVQTTTQGTTVVATSPGHTSGPPSSSTGSTPPPILQTSTEGTTIVTTRPGHTSAPPSSSTGSTPPPILQTSTQGTTVVTTRPGHTSAPPSSSTGSTPPPIVQGTTQGTTVVATSPGHTSAPPSSSTGSTPPPIVQTTTQGTTVVATSPAKGTTTTLSTPLSTVPGTTTGPGSTPAVTSATVSTTTATSLHSTPVSKPTGSIPTEGTTPEVKQTTTPVVEITSLPPLISTTLVVTESSPSFAHTTSTATLSSSVTSPLSTTNGTSVTTQTSVTSVSSSTLPALTTKIATTGSTVYIPVTSSSITPCFCHVSGANGGLFSPGEVIYNRTDSSGCSFYAICDNSCEVKRSRGPCPSTTPSHPPTQAVTTVGTSPVPPTPIPTILIPSTVERTTSAPSTTTLVIPTTPAEGCPNADPPRKTNETWMFNNCSMATCEGNNRIVVVLPPPADNITCANRLPPVKINHDDGCTHHYECACVCSGWDNSHYETFDGTNYTFHDNCTYVLVQEVVKKHGNFSVLVDNYFCDPANNESCSRSIIINYKHTEIVLSSQMYNGMRTNKVIFNKEIVRASFSKDGITVADTGTTMSVEILDIQAFINFNGFTFSIQIPFDLFAFNTEGQCGTCSNDRSDDCRLPSGHKVSSCSEMAPHWKVNNGCEGVNPTPEPTGPPPTEVPCTTPSPLCELIVSDIFADCHEVLPPKVFYDRCLSEVCQNENDTLTCYSVEMYASLCISKGVCTDWRKKTEGKCPYHCPKGKVYEACGPVYPSTCDNGKSNDITEHVAEGCFCPAGQILVNSHTDTCVQDCDFCIGPDGSPQMPGTKWRSNCQECICDPLSVTVQCKAEPCSTPATPACQKEGLIPVSVLTPEDPCCPEIQCICNTSACSNRKKSCEPGYALSSVLFEGDCCVTFLCEPIPDICVVNGTVYTPGASVPSDSCERCVCGYETDPSSKSNLVECEPVPCDTACSEGYEYQVKAGKCCGTCVQVTCIININGTTQMLKPGDTWQSEANNCSYYECEKEDNELVLVNNRRTCPFFDPKECGSNETELTPDGCCKTCKLEPKCKVRTNQILIRQNECVSSELVELTYCEGACPSSSMYSTEARAMQHKCTCCQELKSHKKKVSLTCQDGTTINYDYIYVDECQCMTACIPEAAALQ